MKLELFYPTKPYTITQSWGVPNDAYLQFGFNRHNGIDITVDKDATVKAMCDGVVTETGNQPTGAGIYMRYRTGPVEAEGETCLVEFTYMHAKELLVNVGDKVRVGDNLIIADNTGFSTGPHTHIMARRWGLDNRIILDKDQTVNFSFDHSKYFNGRYADDIFKYIFDTDIGFGQSSDEVKKLQQALQVIGYFPVEQTCTGFYGSVTRSAVFKFQKDYVANISAKAWWAVWMNMGKYCSVLTRQQLNKMFA